MIKIFTVCLVVLFLAGCREETQPSAEKEPGIVDYMTGAEQLKIYQKTRTKLDVINESRQDDVDDL